MSSDQKSTNRITIKSITVITQAMKILQYEGIIQSVFVLNELGNIFISKPLLLYSKYMGLLSHSYPENFSFHIEIRLFLLD